MQQCAVALLPAFGLILNTIVTFQKLFRRGLCAGASGGRRRLHQAAALSPTSAATQLAAVQGPIFGVLSAAGAAMVVGETPAVISGGTVRINGMHTLGYHPFTLNDVAMVAGETPAVISGGTVRAPWPECPRVCYPE